MRVVAGVLTSHAGVFICRRSRHGAFPLKWEFPGGKIEQGEDPVTALRRELAEELHIEAVIGPQIYTQQHVYAPGPHVWLAYYHVPEWRGPLDPLGFDTTCWCDQRKLLSYDFLDADVTFIRELQNGSITLS